MGLSHLTVIEVLKRVTERVITAEAAIAELAAVSGPLRDAYNLGLDGKSWGGRGGAAYDDDAAEVFKRVRDRGTTAEAAIAEIAAVSSPLRLALYILGLDGKSSGGKIGGRGGAVYDDHAAEVLKRVTERGITEGAAIAQLAAVSGPLRDAYNLGLDGKSVGGKIVGGSQAASGDAALHLALDLAERQERRDELFSMLVELVTSSDHTFIIKDWIAKVLASTGSIDRTQQSIANYRLVTFTVHGQAKYLQLCAEIRELTLTKQPTRRAPPGTKDAWRTACARIKLNYIHREGMVHTFLYYKWTRDLKPTV